MKASELASVHIYLVIFSIKSCYHMVIHWLQVCRNYHHTAYTVDVRPTTSILLLLSLIDMIYRTADTKAKPASVQGVGVDF